MEGGILDNHLSLAAFTALAQRYEGPLYAFLRNLTVDAEVARDLLQDTFCDAWHAAQQRKAPFVAGHDAVEVRRWLFHVAYRHAISTYRHQRLIRWESLEAVDLHTGQMSETRQPFEDQVIEHAILQQALDTLDARDVACLLLIIVHRFTAQEVAAIMGGSAQAIGQRISRARRRLMAAYLAQNPITQEEPQR